MLRSQAAIKASAKLTRTLGLMFKLNKHVDLIAAKFAADFLDWTQQHSRNHFLFRAEPSIFLSFFVVKLNSS